MEKLSIRNFGPIVNADIDLKKINVFIGPQGSGKSTIAKIISAFRSYNNLKSDWSERCNTYSGDKKITLNQKRKNFSPYK